MKSTKDKKIKELERTIRKLSYDNLRMRLHLEVLTDGADSRAAKIILEGYRMKRARRKEQEQAERN
jgi:hypothetical protein